MKYWIATLLLVFGLHTASAQQLHIVILGDSNTWLGGDNCDKPRGWNKWFSDRMKPQSIRSYARSGATWTHTLNTIRNTTENIGVLGDNNVIYNQVCRLVDAYQKGQQQAPQLILIMAGTNDVWFKDQRPHALENAMYDVKCTTLTDAVRTDVGLLRESFPTAQIILLTPMQTTSAPYEDIVKAGDLIEEEGHRLGCGVIRMDQGGCISSLREQQKKQFTTDGTHTNEAGARRNGYYIARQVQAMLEY